MHLIDLISDERVNKLHHLAAENGWRFDWNVLATVVSNDFNCPCVYGRKSPCPCAGMQLAIQKNGRCRCGLYKTHDHISTGGRCGPVDGREK